MSDHHAAASEGARASNWLWAVVACVVAACVAVWLTGMGLQAALLLGGTVFIVYAVVLAQFWEDPPHGDAHDHGHHGH
jgi:bacteriorhodopsin